MRRVASERLRAASLVEAVVAAVVLLVVFAATLKLLPQLTLREDDALAIAEAEYRAGYAFERYASGLWPEGTYVEVYSGGEITAVVEPYRDYDDMQVVTVVVRIDGSRKRITCRKVVEWQE